MNLAEVTEGLPGCTCPPEAIACDDDCPRGFEIDRRTAGMTPGQRLELVRGQD